MGSNVPADVQEAISSTSSIVKDVRTAMASPDLGGYISGGSGGGGTTFLNSLMCPIDSDCYKKNQTELLKKIMDDNQQISNKIPMELSQSEKNYYELSFDISSEGPNTAPTNGIGILSTMTSPISNK